MDETTVMAWLASKADAQTLFMVSAGILVGAEIVKRSLIAAFPSTKEFTGWWLVGGAIGTCLGLGLVETSAGGAIVGLVAGVMATGGYEYIKHAAGFLVGLAKGPALPLILLALGAASVLSIGGCAGHGYLVAAQEAQLDVYDQVEVGIAEYHQAALAELANADQAAADALCAGLAEDLQAIADGDLVVDPETYVDQVLAEYTAQLASNDAERAVLADRLSRLREVIGLGRQTATRAAEIEVRRYATLDSLRQRLLDVIASRSGAAGVDAAAQEAADTAAVRAALAAEPTPAMP